MSEGHLPPPWITLLLSIPHPALTQKRRKLPCPFTLPPPLQLHPYLKPQALGVRWEGGLGGGVPFASVAE